MDREAVPLDASDGGCRDRGCADAGEATIGEVEFIARVEEVAGPEYARGACPELEASPSLSSTEREVQQPWSEKIQGVSIPEEWMAKITKQPVFENQVAVEMIILGCSRVKTYHGS